MPEIGGRRYATDDVTRQGFGPGSNMAPSHQPAARGLGSLPGARHPDAIRRPAFAPPLPGARQSDAPAASAGTGSSGLTSSAFYPRTELPPGAVFTPQGRGADVNVLFVSGANELARGGVPGDVLDTPFWKSQRRAQPKADPIRVDVTGLCLALGGRGISDAEAVTAVVLERYLAALQPRAFSRVPAMETFDEHVVCLVLLASLHELAMLVQAQFNFEAFLGTLAQCEYMSLEFREAAGELCFALMISAFLKNLAAYTTGPAGPERPERRVLSMITQCFIDLVDFQATRPAEMLTEPRPKAGGYGERRDAQRPLPVLESEYAIRQLISLCYKLHWFPVADARILEMPNARTLVALQPGGDWIVRSVCGQKTLESLRGLLAARHASFWSTLCALGGPEMAVLRANWPPNLWVSGPAVEHARVGVYIPTPVRIVNLHLVGRRDPALQRMFVERGAQIVMDTPRALHLRTQSGVTFEIAHHDEDARPDDICRLQPVAPLRIIANPAATLFSIDALLSFAHGDLQPFDTRYTPYELVRYGLQRGFGVRWRHYESDRAWAARLRAEPGAATT